MLYHNLKLAFRNLWRHKTFSLINILGLTIGLASCIIIGLYAFNELSFDHFNKNHGQVFRVNKVTNEKDKQAQHDGITSWSVFIIAALASAFVALFTISFQAIKAATANPVKSLRTE